MNVFPSGQDEQVCEYKQAFQLLQNYTCSKHNVCHYIEFWVTEAIKVDVEICISKCWCKKAAPQGLTLGTDSKNTLE